jgi:signal transduction histidine kinase
MTMSVSKNAFEQTNDLVNKLRKMVLHILYYSKSRELYYETLNAEEFSNNLIWITESNAIKNNIKLDIIIEKGSNEFEADSTWFRSAMVNLLENSIEACISDSVKNEHKVVFHVNLKNEDRIFFEIKDNGIGMDQETKEKLFTLFFSSKGSQGTGIGMFIANYIITQHRGSIIVESELNKGSILKIEIPRKKIAKEK